ncbi:MAG: proton-conducting transporter membrane subunit [Xanthomonadales bacterium]|nr:proton-conducting transporter membrane subunit [Xanthomonadales bacterium]
MSIDVQTLIPLFVAVPLGMSLLVQLLARHRHVLAEVLSIITLLLLALMSCYSVGHSGIYHLGGWPTPVGIDLRLDALATLLLLAVNIVGLAVSLYSVDYMRRFTARSHFYSLFLLMVTGMNGVILAGDLFNLYVFLEVAAIASYSLVAFGCAHEELEASFKYIVLGSLSSALILTGVALVYGITGTLNLAHIAARIAETGRDTPLLLAFGLFICGFSFKAALVPFHAWLPDAHPAAPAPVSAMLSGVLIKAIGIYVLARLAFNVFGVTDNELSLLRWLGLLSMVTGGLLATGQKDIKRLFAYSSISQVGFMVLGLGLGTPLGLVGGLYHLVNHAFFKSLLFLNAGAVEYATGTRNLKQLGGLNRQLPVTAATSLVGSMSIAGIPPFSGFWSKLIIVLACIESGYYGFATVAVLVSIVTLAYQLKVQRMAFFAALPETLKSLHKERPMMATAMILLAIACIALAFAVLTGLRSPWLVGAAQQVLTSGIFGG